MSPQNGTILKGNVIEPNPSIFRGYVSFHGDIQWWCLFLVYIYEEKDGFYSIELFQDVVSFTLKICWSLGIYRNVFFGPFRPWESWSSGKPKCVDLARKAKMISWAGNFFKNLKEANSALVYIRFVEHLMLAFSRLKIPPFIMLRYPRRQARMAWRAAETALWPVQGASKDKFINHHYPLTRPDFWEGDGIDGFIPIHIVLMWILRFFLYHKIGSQSLWMRARQ